MDALIFDCDGVLALTERDGHRVAFNRAFERAGLDTRWDEALYGRLVEVSGGKERMRHHFEETGWPRQAGVTPDERDAFIRALHKDKTETFMSMVEGGDVPLRTGVVRLVDEAVEAGLKLAVCSTSNVRSVTAVVAQMGEARAGRFSIFAGDMVSNKKPDPEIYDLARRELGISAGGAVVVEDTRNGLLAAKAAGFACIVTTSAYTRDHDFAEADRVVGELGDPPGPHVTLDDLRRIAP